MRANAANVERKLMNSTCIAIFCKIRNKQNPKNFLEVIGNNFIKTDSQKYLVETEGSPLEKFWKDVIWFFNDGLYFI